MGYPQEPSGSDANNAGATRSDPHSDVLHSEGDRLSRTGRTQSDSGAAGRRVNESRGGSQTCITDAGDPDRAPSPEGEGRPC